MRAAGVASFKSSASLERSSGFNFMSQLHQACRIRARWRMVSGLVARVCVPLVHELHFATLSACSMVASPCSASAIMSFCVLPVSVSKLALVEREAARRLIRY